MVKSAGYEVLHVLRTSGNGDIVLLNRVTVIEEHVPPVVVTIVAPLVQAVDCTLHNPRTVRILGLVIYTGEKLLHIVLVILHILVALRVHTEDIVSVY